MPLFLSNLTKTEQNKMSEVFEAAWEWAEAQTIEKLKIYAKSWFGTLARVRYKIEYEYALWVSSFHATKIPFLLT